MTEPMKPSYWYCDACSRLLLHGEYRFNCTVCDNYDYCEQCITTVDPPHPHRMVLELAYGREETKECANVDMATAIRAAIAMYSDRHCMGIRDVDKENPSIYMDSYSWFTFKTIGNRSKNFGHGLRHIIEPRGYLAICAGNRPEWMITDFACIFQSMSHSGLSIHFMGDIEQAGFIKNGSSGFPKGAMISESAYRATFPRWCLPSSLERITLSYRPLAWAADRDAIITTFLCGGRTGFSTEDPSRLMDELALVRPTYFGGPPSIWNKIYTEFKISLALITAHCQPEAIADEEQCLLQQFSRLIPNRCKSIAMGGAMVSPVVFNFLKQCFTHCSVNESYGITECGSVAYNNLVENSLQYRLESVPEMGYTVEDEPFPRGELLTKTPQMFSGYINNPEETSAALTEDGFFRTGDIVELCTSRNGQINIHVIDRKKNFFKLAQNFDLDTNMILLVYQQTYSL
ncbi:unnamed protein product [Rotaria sordida]|uniref:long-chain-fatty-acid--CoA ligase n=1 Tax=Rotaria sordida TaxID=392033 RepID=A0A814F2W6_9BILA|nr:unnamed protein product [Rotaria sordida]